MTDKTEVSDIIEIELEPEIQDALVVRWANDHLSPPSFQVFSDHEEKPMEKRIYLAILNESIIDAIKEELARNGVEEGDQYAA